MNQHDFDFKKEILQRVQILEEKHLNQILENERMEQTLQDMDAKKVREKGGVTDDS